MRHTPGRWMAYPPEFTGGECWEVQADCGMTLVVCGADTPENCANATLVAAAPELLAALRKCADRLGEMDCGPELEEARRAIAKAEAAAR